MKEKRKTRLDKSETTPGFIGFSAFADTTIVGLTVNSPSAITASSSESGNQNASKGTSAGPITQRIDVIGASSHSNTVAWHPVYEGGDDAQLYTLFPRLHKKDATTVVKALADLSIVLADDSIDKRSCRIPAIQHYAYVYARKLHYHTEAKVRAQAIVVWNTALEALPKATQNITDCHPVIVGMWQAAKVDPAAEVRQAAASLTVTAEGVTAYVHQILAYGRPSAMHRDLFAVKSLNQDESGSQLSEQQKDQLEEKYERIVGTALHAMRDLVQQHPEWQDLTEATLWWKTLLSPSTALRRQTYQLLSAVASSHSNLLPPINTILQVLAQEKQAVNLPILLETVVAYLAATPNEERTPWVKPLTKILQKAVYGSHVHAWGPTLLPLSSFFAGKPLITLLQATWEGREWTLGAADRWLLLTFLAETISFWFLRKKNVGNDGTVLLSAEQVDTMGQLWRDILRDTLSKSSKALRGAMLAAFSKLLEELAKNAAAWEAAKLQSRDCDFLLIADTFWSDAAIIMDSEASTLTEWVTLLSACGAAAPSNPLNGALAQYFQLHLKEYQQSSGKIPDTTSYALFLGLLEFCGPAVVLDDLERFVMNDLLKWIIIHTSSISSMPQTTEFVEYDFSLLALALGSDGGRLWETVLREVIKAKCDLEWLTDGIRVLMQSSKEWIKSDTLDSFALDVSRRRVLSPVLGGFIEDNKEAHYSEYRTVLRFLSTCLGLHDNKSRSILSDGVLQEWTNELSKESIPSFADYDNLHCLPRLEVLLQLVKHKSSHLPPDSIENIIIESWVRGGALFVNYTEELIENDSILRTSFLRDTTHELASQLNRAPIDTDDHEHLVSFCETWANRASIVYIVMAKTPETKEAFWPSVGLAEDWTKSTEIKYLCSIFLFKCLEDAETSGLDMMCIKCLHRPKILVNMLLSLSEASDNLLVSKPARSQNDRAANLSRNLGLVLAEMDIKRVVINDLLDSLENVGSDDYSMTCKHVSIISFLLNMTYPTPEDAALVPGEVRSGDQVWYVVDPKNPAAAVPATITKVHHDDIAGFYFSIRLDVTEGVEERQTVTERLRRHLPSPDGHEERTVISHQIFKIVREVYRTRSWKSSIPELLCVILSLGSEARGIGSVHYDILRLVSEQEACVKNNFDDADEVWKLVFSIGFGLNVYTPKHVLRNIPLGAVSLLSAILSFSEQNTNVDISLVILAGMCLQWTGSSDLSLFLRTFDFISRQAEKGIRADKHVSPNAYCAMKALSLSMECLGPTITKEQLLSCQDCLSITLHRFFISWEDAFHLRLVSDVFEDIIDHCSKFVKIREILHESLSSEVEERLFAALYDTDKRVVALKTIMLSIKSKHSDTESVSRLVNGLLLDIQSTPTTSIDGDFQAWQAGRFISWLILLELARDESYRAIIDYNAVSIIMSAAITASAEDISSLLRGQRTESKNFLTGPRDIFHKSNHFPWTELEMPVIFRTVECLPSLTRRWWEEDCPKHFMSLVKDFVKSYVTPEMINIEIMKIKEATNFGEMKVSASPISREFVASYVQDDFTLKVSIQIPVSFPFRSAEVDCSKTLGVPQKRWKRWNMMISQMLNNQDSTLLEALMLWKENVDKEYEGVEPCVICYSCISVKTHKLPTLECKNCHNRFHHDCLMQWFQSSGKNQCVLCQVPWQGTRV